MSQHALNADRLPCPIIMAQGLGGGIAASIGWKKITCL
jgi:hypothetical protein